MLIATIENQDYLLKDSKDAEALLRVLQRAKKLESIHRFESGIHYSESQESVSVKISINTREILSQEDMDLLKIKREQEMQKRRAKRLEESGDREDTP
ncbi:hypothetical protein MO867_18905 [Microbulbifer sp. OS29]|uniref:Uncharacterized protein n=1 Tax=Microbulbifer okhotskensis TaxID=2926617 RepID=A0A9X2EQA6_9GAMM|nr:hypothetical protein [Microbulbifer okhotskensis]MCO1336407.1 hypothetical protein [Microbulbifer okhotskensis]